MTFNMPRYLLQYVVNHTEFSLCRFLVSDPYRTSSSGHNGTSMPLRAVAIVIYVTAAACILAVVVASIRKWLSCGVRIHSAPEEPNEV